MAEVQYSVPPSLRPSEGSSERIELPYFLLIVGEPARDGADDAAPQWWVGLVTRTDELSRSHGKLESVITKKKAATDRDYLRRSRRAEPEAWEVTADTAELSCRKCPNSPKIRTKRLIAMARQEWARGGSTLLV